MGGFYPPRPLPFDPWQSDYGSPTDIYDPFTFEVPAPVAQPATPEPWSLERAWEQSDNAAPQSVLSFAGGSPEQIANRHAQALAIAEAERAASLRRPTYQQQLAGISELPAPPPVERVATIAPGHAAAVTVPPRARASTFGPDFSDLDAQQPWERDPATAARIAGMGPDESMAGPGSPEELSSTLTRRDFPGVRSWEGAPHAGPDGTQYGSISATMGGPRGPAPIRREGGQTAYGGELAGLASRAANAAAPLPPQARTAMGRPATFAPDSAIVPVWSPPGSAIRQQSGPPSPGQAGMPPAPGEMGGGMRELPSGMREGFLDPALADPYGQEHAAYLAEMDAAAQAREQQRQARDQQAAEQQRKAADPYGLGLAGAKAGIDVSKAGAIARAEAAAKYGVEMDPIDRGFLASLRAELERIDARPIPEAQKEALREQAKGAARDARNDFLQKHSLPAGQFAVNPFAQPAPAVK